MSPPKNAAAPDAETEGGERIELGGEITPDSTSAVKPIDPARADSDFCPYACSYGASAAERSRCPSMCRSTFVREVAS